MAVSKATQIKKTVKKRTPIKGKVVRTNKDNPNSKYTNKSEIEKEEIKCLISIGLRKNKPFTAIIADVKESGKSVAVSTFYNYVKDIRNEWRTAMSENYETHVASQYAKLDLMEERLWQMLDKSMSPDERKIIERQGGRLTTEKTETTSSHGDVEIMKMIERIWVRRNEILGITSSTINIQNNIQNNIEQTNIENKVEVNKVEFQPVADQFFGNFVIEVEDRQKA